MSCGLESQMCININIHMFGSPDYLLYRFPDVQLVVCPDVKISCCPDILISRLPGAQMSRCTETFSSVYEDVPGDTGPENQGRWSGYGGYTIDLEKLKHLKCFVMKYHILSKLFRFLDIVFGYMDILIFIKKIHF